MHVCQVSSRYVYSFQSGLDCFATEGRTSGEIDRGTCLELASRINSNVRYKSLSNMNILSETVKNEAQCAVNFALNLSIILKSVCLCAPKRHKDAAKHSSNKSLTSYKTIYRHMYIYI